MFGCTVNGRGLCAVVPAVTVTGPEVAPLGTLARIVVSDRIVNGAGVPLNSTSVVSEKPLPLMKTFVPTGPRRGCVAVIVGSEARATVGTTLRTSAVSARRENRRNFTCGSGRRRARDSGGGVGSRRRLAAAPAERSRKFSLPLCGERGPSERRHSYAFPGIWPLQSRHDVGKSVGFPSLAQAAS